MVNNMIGKILYVKNSSSKVNLNTYNVQALGLGRAFCRQGFDYDFIYFSNTEKTILEENINGHKLQVISKKGTRLLRSYVCNEVLDRGFLESYDIVISTEYGQIMTYLLSKNATNVVMYSGPYYNLFKIPFISPIYDKIFTKSINSNCSNKFVKSELAKEYLEKKGYTDLINIGVGLDTTRFDKDISITPQTNQIERFMRNNRCILYVGALSDRKNFSFMLEVYEEVLKTHPDMKFVLIGKGNKQYVESVLSKVSEKVRNGLLRVDSIDNEQLKFIYPLAKAFLLPSKLEIFGMVLLEAMYLGAPVITSWNGGSSTLISGKETGQIVRIFDAKLWANAVIKYVDNDEYTSNVTTNARELVSKVYNWDNLAEIILNHTIKGHKN